MKIENCTVDVSSGKELYDVETLCFAQDIVWCGSGREHVGKGAVDKMKITRDLSIIHNNEPGFQNYSADEFIKRFGGKSNNRPKYRIKTEKEFIKEFGDRWRNKVECGWIDDMDSQFGHEFTADEEKKYLKRTGRDNKSVLTINGWNYSEDMIIETSKKKTKVITKHRIKTEEEFIKEFGIHWVSETSWNNEGRMDYLFGRELSKEEEHKHLRGDFHIDDWTIDSDMITEIKQTTTRRRKVSLIDRFLPVPKVSLNHSLYRRRKTERVNLDQYN